ncbi:MAG: signal peptide peptidase SppA [Synechococcales bacterium]|nr:signal peptide peptidase SppA [Synechococcales bacterium]
MRDFLKYVLASVVGLIVFTTLGIGAITLLLLSVAIASRDTDPAVADQSILVFDLSTEITDSQPSATASDVIGEALLGATSPDTIALRTVLEAIDAARTDERIVGLYLTGNINAAGFGSGFATLREVRQAIEDFKESGKPVIAYDLAFNERDYYLISAADTVILNPTGLLELNGFSAESLFFGEALDKFGIGVSAIRAGAYKSAVEPFTRSDRSPEEREQTLQLLNVFWQDFLSTVATARDLTPSQLQTLADTTALILPETALTSGLIDQVGYFDEVLPQLRALTTEAADENRESFRQIDLPSYGQTVLEDDPGGFDDAPQIAVVYAEGNIVSGMGGLGQIGGDRFAEIFREIRLDEDIKAVVLRINSPGGSDSASKIMAREIKLTQAEKPVIVSMGSVAASGGYLIATYSDRIYAQPTTITGSIGVFGLFPNFQELANRNGVTWDIVKTGRYADLGTVSRPPTPEEAAIAQRFVDQIYDDFLTRVAESRSISRQQVAEIAEGRVWAGSTAQEIGLVDEIGGLEVAIEAAAAAAELGDNWSLQEYPQARRFDEELLRDLFGTQLMRTIAPLDPLSTELHRVRQELETLRSLNDPRGIYSRLPFDLWVD